jgi:hypothetical protein
VYAGGAGIPARFLLALAFAKPLCDSRGLNFREMWIRAYSRPTDSDPTRLLNEVDEMSENVVCPHFGRKEIDETLMELEDFNCHSFRHLLVARLRGKAPLLDLRQGEDSFEGRKALTDFSSVSSKGEVEGLEFTRSILANAKSAPLNLIFRLDRRLTDCLPDNYFQAASAVAWRSAMNLKIVLRL